jgi:hypothetical protein
MGTISGQLTFVIVYMIWFGSAETSGKAGGEVLKAHKNLMLVRTCRMNDLSNRIYGWYSGWYVFFGGLDLDVITTSECDQ